MAARTGTHEGNIKERADGHAPPFMKGAAMRKATFIGKYHGHGYDAHMVYLVYSYRGHEYTVGENLAQGNEPLAWQHRDEQDRIDRLIEQEEREKNAKPKPWRYEDTAQYAIHQLLNFLDGEPSDFDQPVTFSPRLKPGDSSHPDDGRGSGL